MANTITQRTLLGGGSDSRIVRSIHIASDGTEETDLIIYDNSTFINNVNKGKLASVLLSGNSSTIRLEWDQTTDEPAFAADPAAGQKYCFKEFGGISNPGGAGATGDLVLSTANLDVGDEVFIIIEIDQR